MKHTVPPISIRIALMVVSSVPVSDPLKLPAIPKLKISSKAPKTSPLTPASDSIRLVANEKQCMAPREQIRLTPRTTRLVAVKLVGRFSG